MDLKTFVTEALTQIAAGIKDAQSQQEELGATFSPKHYSSGDKYFEETVHRATDDELEIVEFEVALTVTDAKSGQAGGGLAVLNLATIGGKGKISHKDEAVSRIKFDIFVRWPRCD